MLEVLLDYASWPCSRSPRLFEEAISSHTPGTHEGACLKLEGPGADFCNALALSAIW